ncbi:NACHT, LRR and PYD domains-containing protein 12-like [Salminus brasiliensis]|uniref:NACHT, LRR and PYD domains-containing protein 12-like n=1 Tax=Salminus brasiliensis TaxID=930266 RepID=UPI003B839072
MESKHSTMELHQSSSGCGTSDPRSTALRGKPAEPPETSCVSMKRHWSITEPPAYNSGETVGEPSCVSMKSDWSITESPAYNSGGKEPSCVSMKSKWSIEQPIGFSSGRGEPSCVQSDQCIDYPNFSNGAALSDPEQSSTDTAPCTHTLVGGTVPLQQDSQQSVDDVLHRVINRHKSSMKKKYESLFEGIKTEKNKTLLNRIYTQLYIIEGESEGVNEEHEVLQMEKIPRRHREDTPINYSDIFKPLHPKGPALRSVLTKGIAGIGKTVSVQKFILDWAEGKANQDVDFMFVLPFRELNLIKDHQYSLHGLLFDFHPEIKDLDPNIYEELKAVFIFDGLDESRIPLNFEECEKVSDITMTSSVGVLMTNLIKGELLPSALIWITCRPAAANQILPKHINRVTEIQGFNDSQKEEYFRKRISDQDQAQKIISHIKTARSLHIMCHIPVFCWISATVLQRLIKHHHSEIPKTLTEMYSHFLITQTNMKNQKYEEKDERDPQKLLESNRTMLLKLAELAFKQLMKGNVMFYEEDLRESGIDVTEASVYSGVFTEIFREECVLYQRKVYCFVHLSFQEFLAAVYVFHCYESKNMKELQCFIPQYRQNVPLDELLLYKPRYRENVPLDELLIGAVNKAVESQTGHLDLFLRFLLGISLESNQRLLQGLLSHTHTHSEETTEYINNLIKGDDPEHHSSLTTERSINLFLCLYEMKDQSLSREIQEYLNSEKHSEVKLSPGQCSALACMLLTSDEVLEELDLKKYNTSEEGYERLIPAVTACRRAVLSGCSLTNNSCKALCSALQSVNSSLKELDLSNNDMQDSGVELLSAGLKSSHCKLEKLRLSGCMVTEEGCSSLASALKLNPSHLRELDLTYNHPGELGVKLLSDLLKDPLCKLKKLLLSDCFFTKSSCKALCSALQSVNSSLKELDLSNNDLQDSGVKLLSAGLKNSHCKLEKLRLSGCMVTQEGCSSLASALKSNPSHLRELDLTYNHPGESGVKLLSDLLKDPRCELKKLLLAGCSLTKNSCEALCSALQSVNSSLKELDLSYNDLQDSGVELLSHCKLETLSLAVCNLGVNSCGSLGSTLQSVNSSLKELDLNDNDLQDSGVKLLSAGLKSSYCKLETLRLSGCMITEEGCSSLASALKSSPSHLRELDLTYNHPEQSGMKLLSDLLDDPHCKLEKLLMDCGGKNRMKQRLKKYACKLTLDPKTAHTRLSLCEGNRKVECVRQKQPYPDHPDRFNCWGQVLSVESLTGRCYWEAEWREGKADVAMSYQGIRRKGGGLDSRFGFNNQSWSLQYFDYRYTVYHNKKTICEFLHPHPSGRVGVYLDWPAGTLSFYSISPDTHTLTHIHTLQTTFTEPLYAGIGVCFGSSVCVSELE